MMCTKKQKKLYRSAKTIEELKKLKIFIDVSRDAELEGIREYKKRGTLYKCRTCFHRLCGGTFFGSHLQRLDALEKKINYKLNNLGYKIPYKIFDDKIPLLESALHSLPLTISMDNKLYDIWCEKTNKFFIHIQTQKQHQKGRESEHLKIECANGVIHSIFYEDLEVDSVPEDFDAVCQNLIYESFKNISTYEQKNGSIKIKVLKESLPNSPEWHLNEFCKVMEKASTKKALPNFSVTFLATGLNEQGVKDGGGLGRDYIDDLVNAIQAQSSLFVEVDGSCKLPRISGNHQGILECSSHELETYQNLGKLIGRCYHSEEKNEFFGVGDDVGTYTTGCYFSDALFRGVLSLTAEEVNKPFEELDKNTHIKLAKKILENWDQKIVGDIMLCLDLLNPINLKQCVENNDITTLAKAVALGGDAVKDYMDELMCPDFEKIKENQEEFIDLLYLGIFSNIDALPNLNNASLGSILAPIHSIAKGIMFWGKWEELVSAGPVAVSIKTQGSLNRENLIKSIEYTNILNGRAFIPNPLIERKVSWLKEWLADEATDADIKQFLKFVTGATSLPKNKKIRIFDHFDSTCPFPKVFTCAFVLQLPNIECDKATFIQNLEEAICITDFQMG